MYNFSDREVTNPRTYTKTENTDGTITLTPAPGSIIVEGTPMNAATMTALQNDIYSNVNDLLEELKATLENEITVAVAAAVSIDDIYPVGSVYISVNSTSPEILFGGKWTKLESNAYLMMSDNGGGTATGSNTRNISHKHTLNCSLASNKGTGNGVAYTAGSYVWNGNDAISTYTNNALNIQPRSISVCAWKRVS